MLDRILNIGLVVSLLVLMGMMVRLAVALAQYVIAIA